MPPDNVRKMIAGSRLESRYALLALLCCAGSLSAQAQNERPKAILEVRIEVVETIAGLPESFKISVVNIGDSNILFPKPLKACQCPAGSIYLEQRYTGTGNRNGMGVGCEADSFHERAILDRIKDWTTTLQPGESYSLVQKRSELFQKQSDPGEYEFWAVYNPPAISEPDQRILRNSGYVFPQQQIVSDHLKFTKKP